MTEVLRNEWGMDGFAITDFSGNAAFAAYGLNLKSFDVAHGLMAGTDSWDSSSEQWTTDLLTLYADDPDMVTAMRQASHRILYTVANSHAMNGFDEDTQIVAVTPWWQIALVCLIVVLAVLTAVCVVQLKRSISAKKRSRSAKSI